MAPPYDQRLANEAAAADQCMKLGAVLLKPGRAATGFTSEPKRPEPPRYSPEPRRYD